MPFDHDDIPKTRRAEFYTLVAVGAILLLMWLGP